MKKANYNTTILTIGNKYDFDSFLKFHKTRRIIKKKGFDYATSTYDNLLKNNLPQIKSKKIIIFTFFPFSHWNKYIEHKNYRGIYGAKPFYKKFISFYIKIEKAFNRYLKGKDLFFINRPLLSSRYRDKLLVNLKLKLAHVPVPRIYKISKVEQIFRLLDKGHEFIIKPRYGSMGKGITFLSNRRCQTNFSYRKGKILSRKSDYGWTFRNVKDVHGFLDKLLKKDVYVEKFINANLIDGRKFDLRVYVFLGKVVYIYPRTNKPDSVTTNISQGGKGMPQSFLKALPKPLLKRIKRVAIKTTKALGVNFAGVDVIVDKNKKYIYVLDVNFFPGFPKRRNFDLPVYLLDILISHLSKSKK